MPADQRCARRRRGVALYRLLQVKTALAVRLDREHASAESRRRQREGAVEADVRANIDEGHVGAEPRAEVRDLATLVYTSRQATGDHVIVRVETYGRPADPDSARKQLSDRGVR